MAQNPRTAKKEAHSPMSQTVESTKTAAALLLEDAVEAGVNVCFANPGTSEIDLVGALDDVPDMRAVLALFEGVCSGMADGYGRMTDKPALTLLHMGVGIANAAANLHNARRAHSPIVNLVGDHATHHLVYDAPLASDIASIARPVSNWVDTPARAEDVVRFGRQAIIESMTLPGGVSTLIIPSDLAREQTAPMGPIASPPIAAPALSEDIERAAEVLRGDGQAALYLGGRALRQEGLTAANRIAEATGCRVMCVPFPARFERGAGIPAAERMPYFPEDVLDRLDGVQNLILVGAPAPVSFFYYDGYPNSLVPNECEVLPLAQPEHDLVQTLEHLAEAVGAKTGAPAAPELEVPDAPTGELDPRSMGQAIGNLLPEGAIVADESATSGGPAYFFTRTGRPHTALNLTGGGIGMGLPLASGAAVACPDRPVIAFQGDGGGMYTVQALWTQARENLNVTNIICSNRLYQILQVEQARAFNTGRGPKAEAVTSLGNPDLNWAKLAEGMGVPGVQATTAESFHAELAKALAEPGPHLIEAVL